MEQKIL